MKHRLILFLYLFLLSNFLLAQSVTINKIDTNFVLIRTYSDANINKLYYEINTSENYKWVHESNENVNTHFLCNFEDNVKKIVFSYTDSLDIKILEKHFSGEFKEIVEYSTFMRLDSQNVDESSPPIYKILISIVKLRNGMFNCFYPSGLRKDKGKFISIPRICKDYKIGTWTSWFENGQTSKKINFCIFENIHTLCGSYQEFYENGKIKLNGQYGVLGLGNDKLNKIKYELYENDTWVGVNKEDLWSEYNINGKIIKETIF